MSQLVSRLNSALLTASFVVVGLASSDALADGTFGGNPPKTLLFCGRAQPDAQACGEATAADVVRVMLTPAPPGGDGTNPRLLLCGPTGEGGAVRCEQTTALEGIMELM